MSWGVLSKGNNNAYCQDNYLSWIRWQGLSADQDLTEFVGRLTRLRRDHPIFRRRRYSEGRPVRGSGNISDLALVSRSGNIIHSSGLIGEDEPFGIFLNGRVIHDANGRPIADNSFIFYLNENHRNQEVWLPGSAYAGSWEVVIDTVGELTTESEVTYTYESKLSMLGNSALVLRSLS